MIRFLLGFLFAFAAAEIVVSVAESKFGPVFLTADDLDVCDPGLERRFVGEWILVAARHGKGGRDTDATDARAVLSADGTAEFSGFAGLGVEGLVGDPGTNGQTLSVKWDVAADYSEKVLGHRLLSIRFGKPAGFCAQCGREPGGNHDLWILLGNSADGNECFLVRADRENPVPKSGWFPFRAVPVDGGWIR